MSLRPHFDDGMVELVRAFSDLPDPPVSLDEKREQLTAARRLFQTKYDAGVPFFTKESFQDVVDQIESDENLDRTVSVTGLDGVAVQFPLQTGKDYGPHPYGTNFVCIITKPLLEYYPLRSLLAFENPVCRVQLPIEVAHSTEVRNAQTNQLVSLWPDSDYATVSQEFEQAKRFLELSERFAQLQSTLVSVPMPPNIDKIVAIGCSTMTWAGIHHKPSITQHALTLKMRDLWASGNATGSYDERTREIKCYAQDPIYTPVDEQVLKEAGFTVLDDPRAFIEVDDTSILIAVNPDIPVRQIIADIARPAMMIWNKVTVSHCISCITDPVSPRVEHMIEEYFELPFPALDRSLRDVALYVRRESPPRSIGQ